MTLKEAQESFIYETTFLNYDGLQYYSFKANSIETATKVFLELTGLSVRESAEKDGVFFKDSGYNEDEYILSDFVGCTLNVCINNETKEVSDLLFSIDYIENNKEYQTWPREVKREALSEEVAYQLIKPYLVG
jgi:hypothetical protein